MRSHYYREFGDGEPQFRFGHGDFMWPAALKYLIITTVVCFFIQLILSARGYGSLLMELALNPALVWRGHLWQLITYGFLHGGPLHIFFNMFILWIFGKDVERGLGMERFLALYLLSIAVAGLCSCLFAPGASVVGASGGVLGVLMAFGMLFPRRIVLFMFIIPMPAKMAVILFALIDLWAAAGTSSDNVAHFAHLGGFAFGYLFVKTRARWERYLERLTAGMSRPEERVEDDGDVSLEEEVEMDRLLRKIKSDGLHSLTWREKRFLDRISQRLRNR
jgi:membrane associated rhomboid family serine protease